MLIYILRKPKNLPCTGLPIISKIKCTHLKTTRIYLCTALDFNYSLLGTSLANANVLFTSGETQLTKDLQVDNSDAKLQNKLVSGIEHLS